VDALNGAAWLATDQGDRASAILLLDESIERARATHDVAREATALYYRGRARQSIGDPAGGGADIERALELQTGTGGDADLAAALWWAGASAMFEDDLGLAIERFERCAELSGALGLLAIEARALQLLGVSRLELGDLHGAKSALGKGVPAIADIGDRFAMPVGLSALAGLAAKQGGRGLRSGWPALPRRTRRSTRPIGPRRSALSSTRGWRRSARRSAPRRRSCSPRGAGWRPPRRSRWAWTTSPRTGGEPARRRALPAVSGRSRRWWPRG
jgi:tetratricopeptide (TPR) repeat protein